MQSNIDIEDIDFSKFQLPLTDKEFEEILDKSINIEEYNEFLKINNQKK